jgi:hypothetical protein
MRERETDREETKRDMKPTKKKYEFDKRKKIRRERSRMGERERRKKES